MDLTLLATIIGIVATAFMVVGYLMRSKFWLIAFQAIGNALVAVSFFVGGRYSSAAGVVVATVRMILFGIVTAKGKRISWALIGAIEAMTIAAFLVTYVSKPEPIDFLYLSGLLTYTAMYRVDNPATIKRLLLIPSAIYFLYNTLTQSYGALIETCAGIIAIFVSLTIEFFITRRAKRNEKNAQSENDTDKETISQKRQVNG